MDKDVMLEDGEIEDEDDGYTLLQRPQTEPIRHNQPVIQFPSDAEEEEESDESSSDSDDSQSKLRKERVRKKKRKPGMPSSLPPRKKKYNIWCTDAAEEILTNTLVNCNVHQAFDRSRDVESYNHLAFSHEKEVNTALRLNPDKNEHAGSNKRNHSGTFIDTVRKSFVNSNKEDDSNHRPREISALSRNINSSVEDLAQDIANKLFEEKEDIILRALNIAGKQFVVNIFEETKRIERNGGLLIMNGTRRRTPGGVFFYLLKGSSNLKPDQIKMIFSEDKKTTVVSRKQALRELRKAKMAKRKEAMKKEDFPTLLSKTEAAILKLKQTPQEMEDVSEEGGVKNPPPSPATDGRDNSSEGEDSKADSGEVCFTK